MTAGNKVRCAIGLLAGTLFFAVGGLAFAQEKAIAPTTQEVVAAIKRRAQQILEERRRAREWRLSLDLSQLVGYESNPANDSARKGDIYLSDSAYLTLSKKLTPTMTYQGIYSGSFDNYMEYGDGDYTSQTLTPVKLLWQPGRMWRVDGGVDLNLTYYPRSGPSNYRELKPSIGVRQNLWGSWFHSARYEWFVRRYISKKARDGAGAEKNHVARQDTRHRLRYEFGTTWKDALMKVKQEWYFHDSNDERQDFYDAEDYKVTASVNRQMTTKLSLNASYSFERKNYKHRQVSGITAEARYDDTQTWKIQGTYDIEKMWSVNPSFEYKFLGSNDPTGEYVDTTINCTLTARF